MTVEELIERLKSMPQDLEVLNGNSISHLRTLTKVVNVGMMEAVLAYDSELTGPHFIEPVDPHVKSSMSRQAMVVIG